GDVTTDELLANLLVFCTVTFEATGGPLLGGIFALLRNTQDWNICAEDSSIRTNAVEEMLRCFPNGDGQFLRVATDDCELSGVRIRKGDVVMAPVSAANMDPLIFENPRNFDVRRANANKNIAFSVGPHHCLGWRVAKTFMETALGILMKRVVQPRLSVH